MKKIHASVNITFEVEDDYQISGNEYLEIGNAELIDDGKLASNFPVTWTTNDVWED